MKKVIYKAGKLLKVFVDAKEKINKIKITGDFFVYPEESIEALEASLANIPARRDEVGRVVEEWFKGVEVFGFSKDDLVEVIMRGVE